MASIRHFHRLSTRPTTLLHSRFLTPQTSLFSLRNATTGNPQSVSKEDQTAKSSRATDGPTSSDTGGPAYSNVTEGSTPLAGEGDEATPIEDEMKQHPAESAKSKRKHVEKQGDKPLGPEDHQ